jgi:CDP-L-myo-inositol myo-inositolphosphotransferase
VTERPEPRRCLLFFPPERGAAQAPLFGLEAVERTVLAFRAAGVREFVLVGDGPATARAANRLRGGACARARARITTDFPGCASADEPVLVARADVYYDRGLVARFAEETRGRSESIVAVDRPEAGGDGVPQVLLHAGGGLRSAGHDLVGADAVLVGLALATSSLARALVEAGGEARGFERALARVAQREPLDTWHARELWQPLRDASDAPPARRKVLAGAVGLGDGIVARHLNRRISRRITERLVSRGIKPWQISVASFLGTLGAGFAFAMGHAATGGILAQTASVLDCVDGEIARIRYQDSPFSGVYDALLDRVGDAALIGGMTLYAWLMGAGHSVVAIGFAALAGSSLSMLVKEKYGTQFQRPYRVEHEGRWGWLLLGRDGRLFLALVAGLTGHVEAVLAYLAVGTHVHAGVRIYRIRAEAARA